MERHQCSECGAWTDSDPDYCWPGKCAGCSNKGPDKDAEITALRAQLAAAEERERRSQLALESLTPGGSEYAGDPDRCVAFVRESRESQHRVILDKSKQLAAAPSGAGTEEK